MAKLRRPFFGVAELRCGEKAEASAWVTVMRGVEINGARSVVSERDGLMKASVGAKAVK